eukprot:1960925-Rhodomonas_salina.2
MALLMSQSLGYSAFQAEDFADRCHFWPCWMQVREPRSGGGAGERESRRARAHARWTACGGCDDGSSRLRLGVALHACCGSLAMLCSGRHGTDATTVWTLRLCN